MDQRLRPSALLSRPTIQHGQCCGPHEACQLQLIEISMKSIQRGHFLGVHLQLSWSLPMDSAESVHSTALILPSRECRAACRAATGVRSMDCAYRADELRSRRAISKRQRARTPLSGEPWP